jgi:squalene-hopene/tetraprenyl-beta-curcumene cyclase
MLRSQSDEGAWNPLWFGDQDAPKELSPVYGTATAVEYLTASKSEQAHAMARRGAEYLAKAQNADGGWGGQKGVESKITLTARALAALASTDKDEYRDAIERGFNFIYQIWEQGELSRREPIGLYFSRLWYSEEMYNLTFTLNALKKLKTTIQ